MCTTVVISKKIWSIRGRKQLTPSDLMNGFEHCGQDLVKAAAMDREISTDRNSESENDLLIASSMTCRASSFLSAAISSHNLGK